MEYERIHKAENGIISPSKIRMKLMGPHNGKKKDGSLANSARTSPTRHDDIDFVMNGLLASDLDDDVKTHTGTKGAKIESGNSSAVYPLRNMEDDNLDYDSNASSSSFEFHKERAAQTQMTRSLSRPMSSKWDDAEKWIISKPNLQSKRGLNLHSKCLYARNPEDNHPKFSFDADEPTQCKDLKENPEAVPTLRSVCMRDMGTEMTPATSVEPSRSTTPMGASTPLRSPASSMPTTPRRGATAAPSQPEVCHQMTEEELKQKTRREIVALGKQLGKLNIAAWASKDDDDQHREASAGAEMEKVECEKRASVWEEVEKSKYAARHKREEIKIQAWESRQKANLEAELRKLEAKVEQLHAQAQAKMVKKISLARQKSEEKRAAAEVRKNRDAEKTAAQAELIRQTGKVPPARDNLCCNWWW